MDWWLIQLCFNIIVLIFFLMTFVHVRRNMPGRPYFRKTLKVLESKISVLEDLFGKTEKHIKKAGLMVNKKEESLKQWTHQADHQLVLFNDAIKTARQIKEEILHLHAQLSPMVALQAQQVQQLQQIQQVQQGQGIPPSQMTSPPPSASTSASVTASPPPHPQPSFHLNHLNQLKNTHQNAHHSSPSSFPPFGVEKPSSRRQQPASSNPAYEEFFKDNTSNRKLKQIFRHPPSELDR